MNHGSRDSTAILASLGSVLVSHDPSSQRSVAILDRCQMPAPPPPPSRKGFHAASRIAFPCYILANAITSNPFKADIIQG